MKVDGYVFDSKAEARRYAELKLLLRAGKITGLVIHPVYVLQETFQRENGKTIRPITYEADFCYLEGKSLVVEDVKGVETEVFRIKRKLFFFRHPDLELRITKAR